MDLRDKESRQQSADSRQLVSWKKKYNGEGRMLNAKRTTLRKRA